MRRSVRRNQLSVALFPFLAVLICTMGALIVLLVLMVQQARVHARTQVAEQNAEARGDAERVRERLDEARWRRELLEQSRAEKSAEMGAARVRLAHLEEHVQRLKHQAEALLHRTRQIDEGHQPLENELASARAELSRLQAEIERKQTELDEQRKKAQSQERWYALIPYEGPHSTRRRPIYIECTEAGIVIQPEGNVLLADDFRGPMSAGNPLEAALRAIREHLQRTTGSQLGEPYPLLIVRPSGVVAYNYAREALKSWDDEFGYELVSEDKKLVFGAADPVLAAQLERTIALSRQRQSAMAVMMPRRYPGDRSLRSFSVDEIAGIHAGRPSTKAAGFGNGGGAANTGTGSGAGQGGAGPGTGRPPTEGPRSAMQSNPFTEPDSAVGDPSGNSSETARSNDGRGATSGGKGRFSPAAADGGTPGTKEGNATGRAGGFAYGTSMSNMSGPSLGTPANAPGGGSSSASAGTMEGDTTSSGGNSSAGRGGPNWALQGANLRSTAVTRPIQLAVLSDRIVIVPERGVDREPLHLRVSSQLTPQEIDRFIIAMQHEMKSWGLAVAGGYWKPVLKIAVAPDAEHHFASLVRALEGSGFDIERKQP